MVLMRGFAAVVAVVLIGLSGSTGCSSGLSQTDAALRCNQEMTSKSSCFDTMMQVLSMCEGCFERCGNSCTPQGTCPETYLCPGDAPIDAGSTAH